MAERLFIIGRKFSEKLHAKKTANLSLNLYFGRIFAPQFEI